MRFKYQLNRLFFQFYSLLRTRSSSPVKTVLFVPYDAVGDLVITTPVFSQLKKSCPNIVIDVLATQRNYQILKNNPYVRKVYVTSGENILFSKHERQVNKLIRQQKYDLVVDLWDRVSFSILLRLLAFKAKKVIGLRKPKSVEVDKGFRTEALGVYDTVVENDCITFRRKMLTALSYFNLNPVETYGELYLDKEVERYGEERVNKTDKSTVYLNLYGSHSSNTLPEKLLLPLFKILLAESDCQVLVSTAGKKENEEYLKNNILILAPERIQAVNSTTTLMEEASLIKHCDYIVTMNTATLHIAQAFHKHLILLEDKLLAERYNRFPIGKTNETILFFNEADFMESWKKALQ